MGFIERRNGKYRAGYRDPLGNPKKVAGRRLSRQCTGAVRADIYLS